MLTTLFALITWFPVSLILYALAPAQFHETPVVVSLGMVGFLFWWLGWYVLAMIVKDVLGLQEREVCAIPHTRYPLAQRAGRRA